MPKRADLALRRMQADTALNLSRVHRSIERRLHRHLVAHGLADVTPAQANVLMILFQERTPMTARTLSGRMDLSEVTVGRFVRALEESGWIVRAANPQDARAILLSPSRKAYRAFPRFVRVSNALLEDMFAGLSAPAMEQLVTLTERLVHNLSRR